MTAWNIFKVPLTFVEILRICDLWILLRENCNISCRPKISSSWTFLLLKSTEVTSTKVSVKRFSYRQIPWLTSLLSALTAKKVWWNFRPTRYITISLKRLQRLQICKISTDVRGTLNTRLQSHDYNSISLTSFRPFLSQENICICQRRQMAPDCADLVKQSRFLETV